MRASNELEKLIGRLEVIINPFQIKTSLPKWKTADFSDPYRILISILNSGVKKRK